MNKIRENLSIPVNDKDPLEKELYKKLLAKPGYKFSDVILRWYRNDKKRGSQYSDLRRLYINNFINIIDLLSYYEEISKKAIRAGNKTIHMDGFDKEIPINNISIFRNFEKAQNFISKIIVMVTSSRNYDGSISTGKEKYKIKQEDAKNIRIVDFSENVVCWLTQGFDTTNKFIFQLWQNDKDMEAGVYGQEAIDKHQSPYCTHSSIHWKDYSSNAFPENPEMYQQFWYFKKIKGVVYSKGDLTNHNVIEIFSSMKNTGPENLIAMDDSLCDLLDKRDESVFEPNQIEFYNEINKIDRKNFEKINVFMNNQKIKKVLTLVNDEITLDPYESDSYEFLDETAYQYRKFLKGRVPKEFISNNFNFKNLPEKLNSSIKIGENMFKTFLEISKNLKIVAGNIEIQDSSLESLEGLSIDTIEGDFDCSNLSNLKSLKGSPKIVKGEFLISNCPKLTSLESSTEEINEVISLTFCDNIETTKGMPKFKNRPRLFFQSCKNLEKLEDLPSGAEYIELANCKKLKSFEGSPKFVDSFGCSDCGITDLRGGPESVEEDYFCEKCESLTSLEGAPKKIFGDFSCNKCPSLENLIGSPKVVLGNFSCVRCDSLKSLEGSPEIVLGDFDCFDCRSLETLEGAPQRVDGIFRCFKCKSLKSLEFAPKDNVERERIVTGNYSY